MKSFMSKAGALEAIPSPNSSFPCQQALSIQNVGGVVVSKASMFEQEPGNEENFPSTRARDHGEINRALEKTHKEKRHDYGDVPVLQAEIEEELKNARQLEHDGFYGKALKTCQGLLVKDPQLGDLTMIERIRNLERKVELVKENNGWYPNAKTGFHELPVATSTNCPRDISAGGYKLPSALYERLFSHQRDGVKWMWKLYGNEQMGGILGDDMGMGKTIQVISFLVGLFASGMARHILIAISHLPSLVINRFPTMRVKVYHGSLSTIEKDLRVVLDKGGVLLTTYDKIRLNSGKLCGGPQHAWDYIILDEGHYIKNQSSQKAKAVRQIPAKHRLLLSGTPIQNNMEELWSLFDYVCNGNLLSSKRNFMKHFGNHIKKGEARDATPEEKQVANQIAEALRNLIAPYFIRREKSLLHHQIAQPENTAVETPGLAPDVKVLGEKKELAVWVAMTEVQIALYQAFLTNLNMYEILNRSRSPLSALGVLKKICDHPALMSHSLQDCEALNLDAIAAPESDFRELLAQSAKLRVTVELVEHLRQEGHRMLLVASSRRMLDIVENCIAALGITHTRIDGTITDRKERQRRINTFNRDPNYSCFLLTTQVAIGITLTGADRVIMYDPSWNPKRDAQAVDRAYRVGQDKDVIVYRILTCGTMEEKVYRNQVRKDYLAKIAMEKGSQTRYFTQSELKDLFTLDDPTFSQTQRYLSRRHPVAMGGTDEFEHHVARIEQFDAVRGTSRHDQLYTMSEELQDGEHLGGAKQMVEEALRQFEDEHVVSDRYPSTPGRAIRLRPNVNNESDMALGSRTSPRVQGRGNRQSPQRIPFAEATNMRMVKGDGACGDMIENALDSPSPLTRRGRRRILEDDEDEEGSSTGGAVEGIDMLSTPEPTSLSHETHFDGDSKELDAPGTSLAMGRDEDEQGCSLEDEPAVSGVFPTTDSAVGGRLEQGGLADIEVTESPSPTFRRIRRRQIIVEEDEEDDTETGNRGGTMDADLIDSLQTAMENLDIRQSRSHTDEGNAFEPAVHVQSSRNDVKFEKEDFEASHGRFFSAVEDEKDMISEVAETLAFQNVEDVHGDDDRVLLNDGEYDDNMDSQLHSGSSNVSAATNAEEDWGTNAPSCESYTEVQNPIPHNSDGKAIKFSVCPNSLHTSSLFIIRNCRCLRTDDEMDEYDELLFAYQRHMKKRQYDEALQAMKNALEICDDDARCFWAVLVLGSMIFT
ncbi:uncharacterized protein SPPG_05541 [Spizellomyces punctatus DAOM BR117]|uniref:Uncharacterized protein n=1 Tax=Spizellomyces punctatus (strain DAOM BR117) TaxID=645134 RepID=A0A0L0HDU5_SPIPD|nr:uncharacterized protein SPPG_05541 [Spizellomyces punctatus DAOM BR117]KNC99287.1 hypothetical protein SPPG_05541 [Spizellomyces punctatus DAOM BR117]|eukprot:XP_016607327.1 hypothetical protein SPPG_05541 [Spizellomyces punctatus DAOM BR117]